MSASVKPMDFRYLGNSGFKISEITFGNWLTHGSQVENDVATQCVRAALDAGISTFDTADVYANTAAETVLGEALKGERRQSIEIFTKVYGPTGPKGKNDLGLSRKHIMESIDGSLSRLQTDYVDLYQAHRYDFETPLEETMQAFADIVRQGKALYIGVSEWTAEQLRNGHALAKELGFQLISNQPQYSMLWRVIEEQVVPASEELGVSQIVWSPMAQGVLSGKYLPGQPLPEGSRATDDKGGAKMIQRWMRDDVLAAVQELRPVAEEAGLTMPQLAVAWVLQNPNVASAIIGASRPEQIRAGVELARQLGFQLISNQPQYSMLWRIIEGKVIPTSRELGVSQIVWSPIAQGVLSGKYLPGQPLPEGSRATDDKGGAKMIERWMRDDVLAAVQELRPVAEEAGLTMPQLAVAWVLQNANVASAIIGASRPEQIADTVAAAGVRLEPEIMKKIDDAVGSVAERDPAQTKSPAKREA